jgi:hypothetical protein
VESFSSVDRVVLMLHLLCEQRDRVRAAHSAPALIMTVPAVEGIVNRHTCVVDREMFESARLSVLLVGYAFHQAAV